MSEKKKKKQEDVEMQNVQEALSKSEAFIETYRKELLYGVAAVVVVVLAVLAFRTYYIAPREVEAQEKMLTSVNYFERDSFRLALYGDGMNDGFDAIVDDYAFTDAAELASAYAGVCAYQLGEYEVAIKYLDQFDGRSINMTPATIGLMGDCYVQLGDVKAALKYFNRAAETENELTAPIYLKKAGIAYESLGDYKNAEKAYTQIKEKYPRSQQASDIDKYIYFVQAKQ